MALSDVEPRGMPPVDGILVLRDAMIRSLLLLIDYFFFPKPPIVLSSDPRADSAPDFMGELRK